MKHIPVVCFRTGTPWKINGWNLQITHERKGKSSEPNLHEDMFHVNLQGCHYFQVGKKPAKQLRLWMEGVLYHLTSMKPCICRNILHINSSKPGFFHQHVICPQAGRSGRNPLSFVLAYFSGTTWLVLREKIWFSLFSFQKKYRPSQDTAEFFAASTTEGTDSEDDHCVTLQRMERPATLVLFSVRSPGVLGGRHRQFPRIFWIRTARLVANDIYTVYIYMKLTFRTCQKAGPKGKDRLPSIYFQVLC